MRRPILVVEDDPHDRELLQLALEMNRMPNPIITVQDGQEALDYLRHEGAHAACTDLDPRFVLMDIKMPRLDGLEVLTEIRAAANLRHIPVVLLTSSRLSADIERAYDLGANGYVVKNTDFTEFANDLAQIMAMWGWHNEAPPEFRL